MEYQNISEFALSKEENQILKGIGEKLTPYTQEIAERWYKLYEKTRASERELIPSREEALKIYHQVIQGFVESFKGGIKVFERAAVMFKDNAISQIPLDMDSFLSTSVSASIMHSEIYSHLVKARGTPEELSILSRALEYGLYLASRDFILKGREADIQDQLEEANMLQEAMQKISSLTDKQEIYLAMTSYSAKLLGAEKAIISVTKEDGSTIGDPPGYGMSDEEIERYYVSADGFQRSNPENIRKWFMGEPLILNDIMENPFTVYVRESFKSSGIRDILIGIMKAGERMLGSLLVINKEGGFTERDGAICTALAAQGAIALENARLIEEANLRIEELARASESQKKLVQTIQEMSTPVMPVYEGIIALPLVGTIDTKRAQQIMENVLSSIAQYQASVVIMDITGVPVMDTGVANHLLQVAKAARLLGSEVIMVGIRPEVAQTIVHLGVDLTGIATQQNLQRGLEYAFRVMGLQIGRQEGGSPRAIITEGEREEKREN